MLGSSTISLRWTSCIYLLAMLAKLIVLDHCRSFKGTNSSGISKLYAQIEFRNVFYEQGHPCPTVLPVGIKNRGLYISAGEFGSISTLLGTLRSLRKQCSPEVIVIGHCEELTPTLQKPLKSLKNIVVKNMCTRSNSFRLERFQSYFCRHLLIVRSQHKHIALIDNDLIWFKSPTELTETLIFRKASAFTFNSIMYIHPQWFPPTFLKADDLVDYLLQYMSKHDILSNRFLQNSIVMKRMSHLGADASYVYYNAETAKPALKFLNKEINSYHFGFGDQEAYWISAVVTNVTFETDYWATAIYCLQQPFFCDMRVCGCNNHQLHYHPFKKSNVKLFTANVGPLIEVKSRYWAITKYIHFDCSKLPFKYTGSESIAYSEKNYIHNKRCVFPGDCVKHERYETVSDNHVQKIVDRRSLNARTMEIELALRKVI